jgi:Ca2+-binding EF-hand superfamily protein
MDVNNDGVLDEEELINHLTKAIDKVRQDELLKQKEVNADGVKEIMKMMDDNGDGMLSKEEMFGKTTQSSKQAIADNRMFDFADGAFGHKDGELDEDEIFIMALPQYSADRMGWYKFKAQDHLEEMDTDGDDEVSFQEYTDAMNMAIGEDIADEMRATTSDQVWLGDGEDKTMTYRLKRKLFVQADANRTFLSHLFSLQSYKYSQKLVVDDMKLDISELANLVQMLEEKNIRETVDDLIKVADDNSDGKLALSEIINHVSDFGGHMAFFLNDPELLFPSNKFKVADSSGHLIQAPKKKFVTKALAKAAAHGRSEVKQKIKKHLATYGASGAAPGATEEAAEEAAP